MQKLRLLRQKIFSIPLHSEHPEMLIKSWQLQVVAIGRYVFQSWGNFGCFKKNGKKIIRKMLLTRQAEETRFKNSTPV